MLLYSQNYFKLFSSLIYNDLFISTRSITYLNKYSHSVNSHCVLSASALTLTCLQNSRYPHLERRGGGAGFTVQQKHRTFHYLQCKDFELKPPPRECIYLMTKWILPILAFFVQKDKPGRSSRDMWYVNMRLSIEHRVKRKDGEDQKLRKRNM